MERRKFPSRWEWGSISQISETLFGQSPPSSSYNKEGDGLPFFQGKAEFGKKYPTAEKWCTEPTKEAEAGDILISIRAPVGPTNIANLHCAIGRGLAAIRPSINRDFVRYWLLRSEQRLAQKGTGTTFNAISKAVLNNHEIPIAPLNEQRRIVEKIEMLFARLDKGEEALCKVRTLLARYRQSVLKAAVTGQLTGGDLETWKTITLGALLEDIRYGTAKKCRPDVEGIAVLRIPNVANGEISLQDMKYAQLDSREVKTRMLRKGDLLMIRSNGSANLVGRSAVVSDDAVGLMFAGYLIRLRIDRKRLLPGFLQLVLNSPFVRARIERQARSTSGVHNINSSEVKAIAFDLPPINVQAEIIDLIEEYAAKIGNLETWCQTELARSAVLRQSILKDAFSGKLVPQNPNDEPAAELLARIRAGRAASAVSARRRRRAED